MKKIRSGNVVINYTITGKGDKTLLFVHGSFIDHAWWREQVSYFKDDYTVITMDLGGHGQSGLNRKTWTVQKFGQDAIAVMKQLELKNVILIGHSLGADAVLEAAVGYPQPVSGIIAIDNFKNAGMPMPPEMKHQADDFIKNLKTEFANSCEAYAKMFLLTPQTDKAIADRVITAYRNADTFMGVKSIESVLNYYKRERKLLQQLQHKLYLINVDYMPTNEEPLGKFAANGYELFITHGSCHFPMVENPSGFNKQLKLVLSQI